MTDRKLTTLTALAGLLAVGEIASAFTISSPGFAIAFAALLAVGALLLWRRRVIPGAAVVGILTLFEVLNYPGWKKHGLGDWIWDSAFAAVAAVALVLAVAVLIGTARARRHSAGVA